MRLISAVTVILVACIPSAFALPTRKHDTSNEVTTKEGMPPVRSLDETVANVIETMVIEADGSVSSEKTRTFQVVDETNDEFTDSATMKDKTTKAPKLTKDTKQPKTGTKMPKSSKCMIKTPKMPKGATLPRGERSDYAFMRLSLKGSDDCSEIQSFFEDNLCMDFNLVECSSVSHPFKSSFVLLQVFDTAAESFSDYLEKNEKILNKLWEEKLKNFQLLSIEDIFSTMIPSTEPSSLPSSIPSNSQSPSDVPSDVPSNMPSQLDWIKLGNDIDGEAFLDRSGWSVSLSSDGKTVAIGAPFNDGINGSFSGHVRVYKYSELDGWTQLGDDIDGGAADDYSGGSVSLSSDGQTVAIGAERNGDNGCLPCHVRVYEYSEDDATWIKLGDDFDGEAGDDDRSGHSVSLSSDGRTVAIGATFRTVNSYYSGHVRVYEYSEDDSSWIKLGNDIDEEAAGDYSGHSVSLSSDGKTVAMGAPFNDDNGERSGHVRVYEYSESDGWTQLGNDIDGEHADDESGRSVSLSSDGKTVAMGAPFNDDNGERSGHVRVFKYSESDGWTQLGNDINGEAAGDYSGYSVSLSSDGKTVVIGAIFNNDGIIGLGSGHVRVYKYDEDDISWIKLGNDIDGETADDYSGYSVSLSSDGKIVAIGALYNNDNGSNSGHVRVFQLQSV